MKRFIQLLAPVQIKQASLEEQYEILKEPRLLAILPGFTKLSGLMAYLESRQLSVMLASSGEYKMLVEMYPIAGRECAYEVHFAAPKKTLRVSRLLIAKVLRLLLLKEVADIKLLLTTCPEGSMSNMARKIGARCVGDKQGKNVFILTKNDLI